MFCGAQCPVPVLTHLVFGSSIYVLLAVAQHGVVDPGQLVGPGGDGLGRAPRWTFFRLRKGPRALLERRGALAASRSAAAARLALALVFELITLPPVMRLSRPSPSPEAKCLALDHFVMSVATSLITFNAVKLSTPPIRVRSTPVIQYNWL